MNLSQLSATNIALLSGGTVALIAYVALIVIPAWTSYGRWWERIGAAFMTLFILASLIGVGLGLGFAVFWTYSQWG
jgi:hypothetical protein